MANVTLNMDMTSSTPSSSHLQSPNIPPSNSRTDRLVRTEFVFVPRRHYKTVHLCGDWSQWQPIPMIYIQPEQLWSVITPVPTGYCEFCYIADGHVTVSHKHPTTNDCSRNWRNVYGPPTATTTATTITTTKTTATESMTGSLNTASKDRDKRNISSRVHSSMEKLADNMRDFLVSPSPTPSPSTSNAFMSQQQESKSSLDMKSIFCAPVSSGGGSITCTIRNKRKRKYVSLERKLINRFLWSTFRILLFCFLSYAIVLFIFRIRWL